MEATADFIPPMPPRAAGAPSALAGLWRARRDVLSIFPADAYRRQVFTTRLPGRLILVANAPEVVREVFITKHETYQRKSRFLVAGLAGLGRLDKSTAVSLGKDLGVNLDQHTRWTRMIDKAAAVNNQGLVSILAGLGMQGDNWDKMTARHLYHIVSALNQVGLSAEARMIAAEAVARG